MIVMLVSRCVDLLSLRRSGHSTFCHWTELLPIAGPGPCFAELSTEFRKPEHWAGVISLLQAACVPNVAGGNPSAAREPGGWRVLNKLFIFSPDTFNHHTHLSDQISAPASLMLSGYSQIVECKSYLWFCRCKWALLAHAMIWWSQSYQTKPCL